MKYLFSIVVMLLSLPSIATPYVKLGYGTQSLSTDEVTTFSDGIRLTPTDSDDIWQISGGFILKNYAVEGFIQHFNANDSYERLTKEQVNGNTEFIEYKRDSNVDAKRMGIKAIYLHQLENSLQINASIGVTVTEYDFTARISKEIDRTDLPLPSNITFVPADRTETAVGGILSLGFDYPVWNKVLLGAILSYSIDEITSTAQLIGTVGYSF